LLGIVKFSWGIIDQMVIWVTDNELWLGNVLPDSMVIVLFMAVAAYFMIQPQYMLWNH
jgi:hypothetical protein